MRAVVSYLIPFSRGLSLFPSESIFWLSDGFSQVVIDIGMIQRLAYHKDQTPGFFVGKGIKTGITQGIFW